jgi:hypothetical protein
MSKLFYDLNIFQKIQFHLVGQVIPFGLSTAAHILGTAVNEIELRGLDVRRVADS